ncbi:cardiolipin synthase [Clostridium vincentii]|uniref:Cardiolipin synthase n=1 Tax=Clostridium vincentii TaxID=52704 RepID=A0A2T0BB74_9CLOT|nr:cardiolipin synthase [Clostridium vincentii]PRR81095.1 Major cardiolipin synthase ClsA [Clostridium vincentii]
MKKLLKLLSSRMIIVGMLILLQLVILGSAIWKLSESFVYLYVLFIILSLTVTVYIISRTDNPSYKLAWVIPVLLFPVFGGLLYLFFGGKKIRKKLKKQLESTYYETFNLLKQEKGIIEEINEMDKLLANQVRYINNLSTYPVYKNTYSEYLSPGENFYEKLICELKKAKHYIFIECFIIQEGKMWNSVLEILLNKVEAGLDVRVIYDDMGCIQTLSKNYHKKLEALGIKTMVFNPFTPILSSVMNTRDHRKVIVIDGHTAFTGGMNLADEYINEVVRFGHWKDAGIMIKGDAVWSFTVMFLQVWSLSKSEKIYYNEFKPTVHKYNEFIDDGYVQPYGDSPYDNELVGENVYLNIINKAKNYIYICTPYLIIDNELVTALTLAAKSGVDVKIVTPHIEDKWYAHTVTRAYYIQLLLAGIKIYEYTPGFIHSKTVVADDEVATVGTINFDYRSLYLHFECGVFLIKTKSIFQIKKDFMDILSVSQIITVNNAMKVKWSNRFLRSILRLFAPMM